MAFSHIARGGTDTGSPVVPMAVGAGLGAGLGYMHHIGEFPGTVEIGQTVKRPIVWAGIVAYVGLGYWLLWQVLQPKTTEAKAAWLATGAAWNLF